jgi:hypothetical protein
MRLSHLLAIAMIFMAISAFGCGKEEEAVQEQPGYSSPQLVVSGICDVGNNIVAAGGVLRDEDNQAIGRAIMSNGDITSRMIYEGIVHIVNTFGDKGKILFTPGKVSVKGDNAVGTIQGNITIDGHLITKELTVQMKRLKNPVTEAWYVSGFSF